MPNDSSRLPCCDPFWLGLAQAQPRSGVLEPSLLEHGCSKGVRTPKIHGPGGGGHGAGLPRPATAFPEGPRAGRDRGDDEGNAPLLAATCEIDQGASLPGNRDGAMPRALCPDGLPEPVLPALLADSLPSPETPNSRP